MLRASAPPIGLSEAVGLLCRLPRVERWGRLEAVHGASMTVAGFGSRVAVGDRVLVQAHGSNLPGEVVAFANGQVTVMPEGRPRAWRLALVYCSPMPHPFIRARLGLAA